MRNVPYAHKAADFSVAVIDAFRRRSKALSRRGATLECVPVKEIVDREESEVGRTDVTIRYRVEGAHVQLRLHVWGNRRIWLDVRRGSKAGWVWEYTDEGRLVSSSGARGLVEFVEETIDASFLSAPDVPRQISAIWSRYLAAGPRHM